MNTFKGARIGGNGPKEEFIKKVEEKLKAGKYFFECVIKFNRLSKRYKKSST